MRRIAQPGPEAPDRVVCVEARGRRVDLVLEPGPSLLDAVRRAFSREGFASGVLTLEGGSLGPLAYVMPALSKDASHAAFYSETHRPEGPCPLAYGALTFGTRDGAPSFHCHALWTEPDGRRRGGHVLPEEAGIASPIRARGVGLHGAAFRAEPDPETNFPLLRPVSGEASQAEAGAKVYALRLGPNQDLAHALEGFCRERGIGSAVLHGGVGSIIGARFADGSRVEPFATELAIRSGRIRPGLDGAPAAEIEAGLVDLTGAVAEGRLVRGDNPVLMTLEVVLEPLSR
jgi:predicted DNA-binding protein with PD1-like motif